MKVLYLSETDPNETMKKYLEDNFDNSKFFWLITGKYYDSAEEAEMDIKLKYQTLWVELDEDEIESEYLEVNPEGLIEDVNVGVDFLDSLKLTDWSFAWKAKKADIVNLEDFASYWYYSESDWLVLRKYYDRVKQDVVEIQDFDEKLKRAIDSYENQKTLKVISAFTY